MRWFCSQLGGMPLMTLHVALHVGARWNHRVAHFISILQRLLGQSRRNAAFMQFTVEVSSAAQIQRACTLLGEVTGVVRASRKG